jgi:hypothetical protein
MFILEGVGFAKHSNVYPRNLSHKTSLTPPHANQVVVCLWLGYQIQHQVSPAAKPGSLVDKGRWSHISQGC